MSGLEKRPRRGDRPRKNDDFLAWKTAGSFYERIFDFSIFGALILQFWRNLKRNIKNRGFLAPRGVGTAPEGIIKPPEASQVHGSDSGDFRFFPFWGPYFAILA